MKEDVMLDKPTKAREDGRKRPDVAREDGRKRPDVAKEPADVQILHRIPATMHEKIRKVAFLERRSVAGATRLLLEEALRARRRGRLSTKASTATVE
jgi:hypothetical protein